MRVEEATPTGIIGKTLQFNYDEVMGAIYEMEIISDSELRWKLTKGESNGPLEDTEQYYINQVAEGIL